MNALERQSLTAVLVANDRDYHGLWQGPSKVIAMLEQHDIIDVFRRLMTAPPQMEFAHRIAFLRYLMDREALHLSYEATILDGRFTGLFPEDLITLARQHMTRVKASPAAAHKAWVTSHAA